MASENFERAEKPDFQRFAHTRSVACTDECLTHERRFEGRVAADWQSGSEEFSVHQTEAREVRTMTQRSTSNAPDAPQGGPAIVLWLFALLIAEAELLLWLLERAYS